MDDDDPERPALPASLELAWGFRDRPTRGPRRNLTLEQIVAAGMEVASAEGLEGVSMARVAASVGVATMSLYRYVAAKDDLLALMVDAALGRPPDADVGDGDGDWRAGLTRWAIGVRAAYRRHPWSIRVPIGGPPVGPNNVAWLEHALRSLAGTPLSEQQKLSTVLLVSGFVRNDVTLTADLAAGADRRDPTPSYGAILDRLIDPVRFPALHRAVASGALDDDDDLDGEFDFGLQRILDGVAALIDAQPTPQRTAQKRRPR